MSDVGRGEVTQHLVGLLAAVAHDLGRHLGSEVEKAGHREVHLRLHQAQLDVLFAAGDRRVGRLLDDGVDRPGVVVAAVQRVSRDVLSQAAHGVAQARRRGRRCRGSLEKF